MHCSLGWNDGNEIQYERDWIIGSMFYDRDLVERMEYSLDSFELAKL